MAVIAGVWVTLAPPVLGAAPETVTNGAPLLGFTAAGAATERGWERQFDGQLQREDLRRWMKTMTAHPHHLGSPFGKEVAEFIATQFRSWGYDTTIEEFQVLFPTPKTRRLEMVAPSTYTARLEEPPLPQDATSGETSEQLPSYNAYSADGDVTGQLVYVNYGIPKDYETLAERGIDVTGRVVIARYGGSWRGIKPKVAAEHGAVGCLIYSDPRDDGYFQGDVYPQGAWRNADGVQRGSVADMPLYPGDPLTPGVGATKDAQRLSLADARTLTRIPVLPISYSDALPLLRALTNGPVAPAAWRGALPLTYHLGPGPATVHLQVASQWDQAPARDIIARLPGTDAPDEWIIRGNHHDAWVCGAEDPISGTVTLLEEARALSELVRAGWHPKRTILFTVWDGEEPGLLGSTEWAETHADELRAKAVAYINTDGNGRGFFGAEGSHTLEKLVNEVARDVIDPERGVSVFERLRAYRLVKGSDEEKREARTRTDLRITALGSGSDYTPFLQHLGIAALNLGYGGESEGGAYHSIYDSFDHYTRFGDPHFDYGIALAQTDGRVLLRLANATVLPFDFTDLADTLGVYVREVQKQADDLRDQTRDRNQQIHDHTLTLVADPTEPYVVPAPKSPVPFFDFAPLQNALARLQNSAQDYQAAMSQAGAHGLTLDRPTSRQLDGLLMQTERKMTSAAGLPRRPWYQHLIYAPGFYTGYGVKTLPGVREAIEERTWAEVDPQVKNVANAIDAVAAQIDRAAAVLRGAAAARPATASAQSN